MREGRNDEGLHGWALRAGTELGRYWKERMSHFGVLSYKGAGHLNSLAALSRRLVIRGHRITFFQEPGLETRVRQYGLEFSPIGKTHRPVGEHSRTNNQRRSMSGIADLRYRIKRITDEIEMYLREAPDAITRAGIDALIIDEIALPGPTLAQMLQLPYLFVSTSVPHNFGWTVPRSLSQCNNPISHFSRLQNALLQVSAFCMCGPVRWKLDEYRRQLGLGPVRKLQKVFPALAHIATLPECLDFPRSLLPSNFYYTGPFVDECARRSVEFPWDRLDGRPLIYVSLGTARKIQSVVFGLIAEACEGLGLQVVISLGGSRSPEIFGELPGNPLIVKEAPQLELIKVADIVINHAGINTVLETLMEGKPMIAIPITHDQPALAARLAWLGIAEVIPEKRLSAKRLRLALVKLLNNASYRDAAREVQAKIRSARGLEHAAEVIEEALEQSARRPFKADTGNMVAISE
jgi:zeaxanthin glucosyltransferase